MSTTTAEGSSHETTPQGIDQGSYESDPAAFLRQRRKRYGERAAKAALVGSAVLSVLITVGIFFALLLPAVDFFSEISVGDFLTGQRWAPTFADASFGVLPLVTGTIWTTFIGLLIAIPFGLGAAIYLAEYAPERIRRALKPVLEVLAGIPSVVYGYFALFFVAPTILDDLLSIEIGTFSVLAAGLVLGIMIIPTVASLSEDAMTAVPQSLRQASFALGANRMRTTLRVVFPGGRLGHHRIDRVGCLPRSRRDDDRGAGGWHTGADGVQPP